MIDTRKEKILNNGFTSEDIANTLLALASADYTQSDYNEIEEFIYYQLYVSAQNRYNNDGFRLFYNLLLDIVEERVGL